MNMEAIEFNDHHLAIDAFTENEYFDLSDQLDFENSMVSLDKMVEDGYITMMD